MWFTHRFSVSVRCSECGKKLNAVEGLSYRDYDFVLEVEPHTCEPANTGLHTDAAKAEPYFDDTLPEERALHLKHLQDRSAAKA